MHNGIPKVVVNCTDVTNAAVADIKLPTAAVTDAGLANPAVSRTQRSHSGLEIAAVTLSGSTITFIAHARCITIIELRHVARSLDTVLTRCRHASQTLLLGNGTTTTTTTTSKLL